MQTSTVLSYLAAAAVAASALTPPSLCMVSPVVTVTAGDSLIATVDNPQGRPCEATLIFSDQDFLPVSFGLQPMKSQPMECSGFQQAEISVPPEAPNGDVTVIWECAGGGVQSCSRLSIEGGSADINDLVIQQTGTMECVVPIATLTTLATSIRSTATVVNAVVETLLSTRKDVIVTGTAKPTGTAVTASIMSTLSGWNSSKSTPLSQGALNSPAVVVNSMTSTGSENHPTSGTTTLTLVVPTVSSTATTGTTDLTTRTGSSLEQPPTIIPVTSGSCSNSAGTT